MDKREVIDKAKAYSILLKKHIPFDKVYLFGSFANDSNQSHSDIDVAIVVKKIEGDYFAVQPLLWKLRRQIDDRIEPILIESENDLSGFFVEIQRNGIEIV